MKVGRALLERVEDYDSLQGLAAKKAFVEQFLKDAYALNDRVIVEAARQDDRRRNFRVPVHAHPPGKRIRRGGIRPERGRRQPPGKIRQRLPQARRGRVPPRACGISIPEHGRIRGSILEGTGFQHRRIHLDQGQSHAAGEDRPSGSVRLRVDLVSRGNRRQKRPYARLFRKDRFLPGRTQAPFWAARTRRKSGTTGPFFADTPRWSCRKKPKTRPTIRPSTVSEKYS